MKERFLPVILVAALAAAALVTLGYRGTAVLSGKPAGKPRVIVIFKTTDFSIGFWRNVRDGAELAAKDFDLDISIRGPWSETSVDEQIGIVRAAIGEKPAAIVLAASDFNRLVPPAREARKQGIKLVCIDSFINSGDANLQIGTDNYEAGRRCAEALLRYVPKGATVGVVSYIKGSSSGIGREAGALNALAGKVRILDTLYSNADIDLAYREGRSLLEAHPDLAGIVALNEPTVIGVARALNESPRRNRIILTGIDNSFTILKFVERGIIKDTIVQKPFNMGYLGVKAVRDLLDGKRVPAAINTGSVDINRATMFQPENQKLLFPVAGGP